MKKLLFILTLLLPTLLFAQQDSSKQTFKIGGINFKPGDCIPVLAGKYYGSTIASLLEIMKKPIVEIKGCGDSARVVSFKISFILDNAAIRYYCLGDSIKKEVRKSLAQTATGSFASISEIKYSLNGKVVLSDKKIIISSLLK